jgi:DNA invertase Pin-like site-specific DNA recombinase
VVTGLGTVFANADVGVKSERTGLGRQRQAIAAACRRRGWQLVKVVEDTGLSSEDLRRPAAREALRLLETADGNGLVAANKGRLSRLLPDLRALIETANKQGWALVALDYALETTPPAAEPVASLLAGFAPCQRQLHSQRIRQALAAKRAQGVRLGRPASMSPYAIERITREHAAGKSLTQIANGLNADQVPTAQGGRRWYPATIRHTLNRTR